MSSASPRSGKPITAPAILGRKGGEKIKMITAYDHPQARIADRAGADIILVGDSLANVVLGHEDTLSVTVDQMVHHTAAVSRAKPRALVVGDMPWMSYHVSEEETVANASRFVREGGAGAVKLEGGHDRVDMIHALHRAEIPVMGHIGLTPQSLHAMGGYRVQGKDVAAARALIADAEALDEAGIFALVLEGVPDTVAKIITDKISAPTIGIGAGAQCDGQVLVFHDLLGFSGEESPHVAKFVRAYADLTTTAVDAITAWFADVESGAFPAEAETYHMPEDAADELTGTGRGDVVYLNPMNEDGTALGG